MMRSRSVRNKIKKLADSKSIVNTLYFITAKNKDNIELDKKNKIDRLLGFFQLSFF